MKHLLSVTHPRTYGRRFLRVGLWGAPLVLLGAFGVAAVLSGTVASAAQPPTGPQIVMQQSFEPTGLPAGAATGTAARIVLPAGFNFKHVHGGPEFVYVLSGSFTVTHAGGSTTYNAGEFAFVGGGMVHTAITADGADVFVLNIRPVGAEWIIPVL